MEFPFTAEQVVLMGRTPHCAGLFESPEDWSVVEQAMFYRSILRGLEIGLESEGIEVKRAPFGWYKEFEMKSKGHPLADLSMTICPYEGRECDFQCPYCHNPIRVSDIGPGDNPTGEGHAPGCTGESCDHRHKDDKDFHA